MKKCEKRKSWKVIQSLNSSTKRRIERNRERVGWHPSALCTMHARHMQHRCTATVAQRNTHSLWFLVNQMCVHMHTGYDSCPFTVLHTYCIKFHSRMEFFPFPLYLSYVNREGKSLKNIGKKNIVLQRQLGFCCGVVDQTHISHFTGRNWIKKLVRERTIRR